MTAARILLCCAILAAVFVPQAQAQGLTTNVGNQTLEGLIGDLYNASVRVVGLCAFLMLLYAGVRRLMGDVAGSNQIIQDALIGTVLLLSAVLILNSINPDTTVQTEPVFQQESGIQAGQVPIGIPAGVPLTPPGP